MILEKGDIHIESIKLTFEFVLKFLGRLHGE